jgi:hypothetical protein
VIEPHDHTVFAWLFPFLSNTERDCRWCAGPDADAFVSRLGQPFCVRRGDGRAHRWGPSGTRHALQNPRQRRSSPAKRPSNRFPVGAFVLIAAVKLRWFPASRNHERPPTIPASLSPLPRRSVRKRCLLRIPLRNPSFEPARLAPGQEGGARIIFGTVRPRTRERRVVGGMTSPTGDRPSNPHQRGTWT